MFSPKGDRRESREGKSETERETEDRDSVTARAPGALSAAAGQVQCACCNPRRARGASVSAWVRFVSGGTCVSVAAGNDGCGLVLQDWWLWAGSAGLVALGWCCSTRGHGL